MKQVTDTNIIINGLISKKLAQIVKNTYDLDASNIIPLSIYEETRLNLNKLSTILQVFYDELEKSKDCLKQLESNHYDYFRQDFPQIYSAFKNLIIKYKYNKNKEIIREKITMIAYDIERILKKLRNRQYPMTENEFYEYSKDPLFIKCYNDLKFIKNDKDKHHITLCNQYLKVNLKNKSEMTFHTADKNDFYYKDHKTKIESLISNFYLNIIEIDINEL